MSVIAIQLMEGFFNRVSQYAWARGYAEKHGCQLQTNFWMGQRAFQLDDPPIEKPLPLREEMDMEKWDGEVNIQLIGWGQHQKSLTYSRAQARKWFTFRPEVATALEAVPHFEVAAHVRGGDYVGLDGFVAISEESYLKACDQYGIDRNKLRFICERHPLSVPELPATPEDHTRSINENVTGLGFLTDFCVLMRADVLLRSNSTFGLWAGWLGDHKRVFSPDVRGLPTNGPRPQYQDAPFVEGNHMPTTPSYSGCSELHLRET